MGRPTTIKEIHDKLTRKDKDLLRYAFENDMAQIVELPGGQYIGIHAERLPYVTPDLISGAWSVGHVKGAGYN